MKDFTSIQEARHFANAGPLPDKMPYNRNDRFRWFRSLLKNYDHAASLKMLTRIDKTFGDSYEI